MDEQDPIPQPLDGTLDLHTFSPRDVKSLIPEYLAACRSRGITQVRIVHGKGTGALRTIVHALLASNPTVLHYRHEGGSGGSWGATVVDLKSPSPLSPSEKRKPVQ